MTRKKTCPRCGRSLWRVRDFYNPSASYCKDCSRALKRAEYARNRKVKDGVRRDPATGRCIEHRGHSTRIYWSAPMIEKLIRIFPTTKNEDCAIELGVSPRTIVRKARELGISKSRAWMQAHSRRNCEIMRIYNKCRGNSGMFKKGVRSSPATEFKPKPKPSGTNEQA